MTIHNGAEATRIDYKLSLEKEKPKSWLKSVSAFANTSGGHIYFGYTDDTHTAVGLDDVQAVASKISELITNRISPNIRFELTEIVSDTNGRNCLDLFVSNGPNYPYYYVTKVLYDNLKLFVLDGRGLKKGLSMVMPWMIENFLMQVLLLY